MQRAVYLDYNATTPVDSRVLERMLPYFSERFGNASSNHFFGWAADQAVEVAKEQTAEALDTHPADIIFTSGATESINTAVQGLACACHGRGRHAITVGTEHSAVREAFRSLERKGYDVTVLDVDENGLITPEQLDEAISDETTFVAVMWANNETGVIHPVRDLAAVAKQHGKVFMTDATQAVGKVSMKESGADVLICSSHKVYGPKGVGVLSASARLCIPRFLEGGSQQRGRRAGTLNVPGIVGTGAALELASREREQDADRLTSLRDKFEESVLARVPNAHVNGIGAPRLPQTSSITFRDVVPERLQMSLRSVAVSAGSACSSASSAPSEVLRAMGLSEQQARQTLRVSMGRPTTVEEVEFAADVVANAALREQDRVCP